MVRSGSGNRGGWSSPVAATATATAWRLEDIVVAMDNTVDGRCCHSLRWNRGGVEVGGGKGLRAAFATKVDDNGEVGVRGGHKGDLYL